MSVRRQRARIRMRGLVLMRDLLECAKLSTVKREVMASLVPALHESDRVAFSGASAKPLNALETSGRHVVTQLRAAFRSLYSSLAHILLEPEISGAPLLQSTLHAFSLQY